MDSNDEKPLMTFDKTICAIRKLQELLKCNHCYKQPKSPVSLGGCGHYYCGSCANQLPNNICIVCGIPSLPCERNPDGIANCLATSCTDLLTLFKGGQIKIARHGLEAPETPYSFQSKGNSEQVTRIESHRESSSQQIVMDNQNSAANKNLPAFVKRNSSSTCDSKNVKPLTRTKITKTLSTGSMNTRTLTTSNIRVVNTPTSSVRVVNTPTSSVRVVNTPTSSVRVVNTPTSSVRVVNTPTSSMNVKAPITPPVNKRNIKGETILHSCCIKGDIEKVRNLLREGANPNTKDNACWTPLHEACSHGFFEIAKLLLEHGALVDVPGAENDTPLHDAVTSGHVEVVQLLRKWGANDEQRNLWGSTPRALAVMCHSPEKMKAALDTKLDVSLMKASKMEPLHPRLVLIASKLDQVYKGKLEKLAKLLKLKIPNDFSISVTHIVASCDPNTKLCHRTMKYMMGVVSGKWILSPEWIDRSLELGAAADPQEFELVGSQSETLAYIPKKGRENAFRMNPGLFNGCHMHICSSPEEAYPSRKDLETLIRAGDGIVLQREPNPEGIDKREQTIPFHSDPDGPLAQCSHYCIYYEGPYEPQLKYDMDHIKSLPLSWLYSCINNFRLVPPMK